MLTVLCTCLLLLQLRLLARLLDPNATTIITSARLMLTEGALFDEVFPVLVRIAALMPHAASATSPLHTASEALPSG